MPGDVFLVMLTQTARQTDRQTVGGDCFFTSNSYSIQRPPLLVADGTFHLYIACVSVNHCVLYVSVCSVGCVTLSVLVCGCRPMIAGPAEASSSAKFVACSLPQSTSVTI